MSVTVDLSADDLAQIKRFTALTEDTAAITKAIREFLRVSQLQELKTVSGSFDYQDAGEAMEALELREQNPNQ